MAVRRELTLSHPTIDRAGDVPPRRRDPRTLQERAPVKILVVDDRAENLLASESVLRNPEYEIVKASSGADALRFLLRDDCAVILMDVQMPDLDGIETARLIRANERTRAIPIVFVTAMSDEERYVARGYDAGAIDYLLKPVDPEMLRAKVGAFVELHRAKQEIVRQAALLQEQEERERQRILARLELASLRRERAAQERVPSARRRHQPRDRLDDRPGDARLHLRQPERRGATRPAARAVDERVRKAGASWCPMQSALASCARCASSGPAVDAVILEHGLVRADGRTLRFETELRVVPAEEEGRFEVRAFSVDVTDARLAEEALSFLDRAGAALAQSLDLATTAEVAAAIGVPLLADAAVVHVAPVARAAGAPRGGAPRCRERGPAPRARAHRVPPATAG